MGWNHRVIVTEEKDPSGESYPYFRVHEVYYDENGVPDGYTANPISISGEDMESLNWTVDRIKESLPKPPLWGGERFPMEFNQSEPK
jgi:hypothetical protein